jgi:outer membrane lipoprotein-sorting protein
MRNKFLIFLMFFLPVSAVAQTDGYAPVPDIGAFKTTFQRHANEVKTISSNFKQAKELSAITERITSYGKFWFKRSDKIRMDYTKPYRYQVIISGDRLYLNENGREQRLSGKSNRMIHHVNRILIACLQGSIFDSKEFSARVFGNATLYRVELTPVSRIVKELFEDIVLVLDKNDFSLDRIEMNEAGGDKTVIFFTEKRINEPLDDEIFHF